jgi:hypothetical protein
MEWRDIPGFEDYYQASSEGQIRRTDTGLILIPIKHSRGYYHVSLSIGSRATAKKYLVHRLVAITFLGPPPIDAAVVNHIDSNKRHNAATNLEWVTQGANINHYFRMREERAFRRQVREQQNDPIPW